MVFTRSDLNSLASDLQNLLRSSVGASEYSLLILSKLFKPFMKYRGNNMRPDKQTHVVMGQPKNNTVGTDQQWSVHCLPRISLHRQPSEVPSSLVQPYPSCISQYHLQK